MTHQPESTRAGETISLALREFRRDLSPRVDHLSSEVWFADYPFRRDPKAVLRQRTSLIAFLARHKIAAEENDELPNSPAIQLLPTTHLERVEALLTEWVHEG